MGCSGHQKSESFKTQLESQSKTNTGLNRIKEIEETKTRNYDLQYVWQTIQVPKNSH